MCACEGSFVCSKCADTPFDPSYGADEYEPMDTAEFDELTRWPNRDRVWMAEH